MREKFDSPHGSGVSIGRLNRNGECSGSSDSSAAATSGVGPDPQDDSANEGKGGNEGGTGRTRGTRSSDSRLRVLSMTAGRGKIRMTRLGKEKVRQTNRVNTSVPILKTKKDDGVYYFGGLISPQNQHALGQGASGRCATPADDDDTSTPTS